MAWSESLYSGSWKNELDNGTTSSGAIATVSQSLGSINPNAWDVDKAGAILLALQPVLSKTIVRSLHTVNNNIVNGDD